MAIQADPEQVAKTSVNMKNFAEEINATMTKLINDLAPLDDAWKGRAAGTFQRVMVQWQATSAEHKKKLDGVGDALLKASQNQVALEDAGHESSSKVGNVLNPA